MKVPVPDRLLPADRLGRVHFVGIGGAGLSAIASIMLERGIAVSGSDGTDSAVLDALRTQGAQVHLGHAAGNLGDADTVVVSTAISEDNPEVLEAVSRGLRLLPRSAGLASVMLGRQVIAVAGTHGKTTTTSLLTMALRQTGTDPGFAVGGTITQLGSNAHDGTGDIFVAEADESDGAFLVYRPHAAVITNVEADHLDNWGTPAAYAAAFDDFLDVVDRDGFVVCCVDDPGAARLLGAARSQGRRAVAVGQSRGADLRAVDIEIAGTTSVFEVLREDTSLGWIELAIPGRHYVLDALAALAAGLELGFGFADLAEGLAGFTGTGRRMEHKGEAAGVVVYDSYAHHPQEIRGDLEAARAVAGAGRMLVAYQPHLVSRTRLFGVEMGVALGAADEVVVLDVYLAREPADPEVTGRLVADAVPLAAEHVHYEPEFDRVAALVADLARPGDLVLTLGAGTVTSLGPQILERLREGHDAGA